MSPSKRGVIPRRNSDRRVRRPLGDVADAGTHRRNTQGRRFEHHHGPFVQRRDHADVRFCHGSRSGIWRRKPRKCTRSASRSRAQLLDFAGERIVADHIEAEVVALREHSARARSSVG